jgi:hypothetical protein
MLKCFHEHQKTLIHKAFCYIWTGYAETAQDQLKSIVFNNDIVSIGLANACFYKNGSNNCFQKIQEKNIYYELMLANKQLLSGEFESARTKFKRIYTNIQNEIIIVECLMGEARSLYEQTDSVNNIDKLQKIQEILYELTNVEPDCAIAHMINGRISVDKIYTDKRAINKLPIIYEAKNLFQFANNSIESKSSSFSKNRLYQINKCFINDLSIFEQCIKSECMLTYYEKNLHQLYVNREKNISQNHTFSTFLLIPLKPIGKRITWINMDYYISRMIEKQLKETTHIKPIDPLMVHSYYLRKNNTYRFFDKHQLKNMAEILDVNYLLTGTIERFERDDHSYMDININIDQVKQQSERTTVKIELNTGETIDRIAEKCTSAIKERFNNISM